ncbi:TetR/AcrR family transcriptional regulator [Phreatobacter aquaticus]|uniref:TetR/AcrR family transcriptional regulator n=1 Tax=Phreatobacter aquaticus TaxID=2570229 RepID=A0A4D7Q911_9HYPH|nr:TetR family transcriptional regulator [Phreatobacter aquaticus]QCK84620.1 TetR/AcrR family transcriptional regulator [Phreatobacter aquaticus]
MTVRPRLSADETRERILVVADEHFRRVGYAKTAVADIASALSMSSANIYRFFPTKAAICEEIARRLLEQCHQLLRQVAAEKTSASERLAKMARTIHQFNKSQMFDEKRLHDMVEAAMTENWHVVKAHLETTVAMFAEVIREGMVAGEFAVQDPMEAALSFKQCHVSVFHPTLIAHCAFDFDLDQQTERLSRFAIRALKA